MAEQEQNQAESQQKKAPESDPGSKIRIHQMRKAILRKAYLIARAGAKMTEEQVLAKMESETSPLFDQMVNLPRTPSQKPEGEAPVSQKSITRRRASHRDRTEHVGRFFLHTMEHQLREAGVLNCVIPVFAKSVPMLIGDEAYNEFAAKIDHLIAFATSKNFDYDQILASKPGKQVMRDIVKMYQAEMATTPGFEEKLRNRLDEALVHFSSNQPDSDFNIEDAIDQSLSAFLKSLKQTQ